MNEPLRECWYSQRVRCRSFFSLKAVALCHMCAVYMRVMMSIVESMMCWAGSVTELIPVMIMRRGTCLSGMCESDVAT